ncbi:large neutral amino acids transporter small subunit 1 [Poronia punctata]|nr:large neutral amino acids transporter small subunit 1 [Poronia punctata]
MNGLAVVIGLQIGGGIFSSPSIVGSYVESSTAAILVWIFAGLLVWTGASTIAQLGSSMPQNGGIQDYLRHCYGDFSGFLFIWIWAFVAKPCSFAMISFIFAEHFSKLVWGIEDPDSKVLTVVALVGIAVVTFINCLGSTSGARVANVFLVLKLATVASVVIGGLFFLGFAPEGSRHQVGENGTTSDPLVAIHTGDPNDGSPAKLHVDYVSAVFGALFAYGGWENIGFLAGELKEVPRILPRIINTAMIIVISCFVLVNLTLFAILPMDVIRSTNKVTILFGAKVLGKFGENLYLILVSLSTLGSLNSAIFTLGRLVYEAGKLSYLPSILGRSWRPLQPGVGADEPSHRRCGLLTTQPDFLRRLLGAEPQSEDAINPVYAMIFNASIASVYILFGSFRGLVTFKGISEYSVYAFTCLSALLSQKNLDDKESSLLLGHNTVTQAAKPYKTYVANPVIFLIVSTTLVVRGIITEPWIGIGLASAVVVGRIAYFWKPHVAG